MCTGRPASSEQCLTPQGRHLQSLDPRLRLGGQSRVGHRRRLQYSTFLFYFFTGRVERGMRQESQKFCESWNIPEGECLLFWESLYLE